MSMAMPLLYSFFERATYYLCRRDPELRMGWWRMQRLRMQDSKLRLLPTYRTLFGTTTLAYFRPGYSPADVGSIGSAFTVTTSSFAVSPVVGLIPQNCSNSMPGGR